MLFNFLWIQRAMYIHTLPKFTHQRRFGAWGVLLFCLLLLSTVAQPSNAQTAQRVKVGVNIGDQFSYKVLDTNFEPSGNLLNWLVYFPYLGVPPQIENNQFQVKVKGFWDNNSQVCAVVGATGKTCQYFIPVIELTYTSGNITDHRPQAYPAGGPGGLIVTTDWALLQQGANSSGSDGPTATFNRIVNFRTQGTNTVISSYMQVIINANTYSFESNETLSTSSIYATQTGVLNYVNFLRTVYLTNGTVTEQRFRVINESYNGSTDVPLLTYFPEVSSSVNVPFYSPVFLLIPIAMIRKRLKSQ